MHDITLYGHMTVDRIFDGFEEIHTLGAMANMWRTFKQIAPNLDIGLCPTSIGEAMIYIDRDSSTRYSNYVANTRQLVHVQRWRVVNALHCSGL